MSVREVAAAGPLDAVTAWERYADLSQWSSWAPLIASVDCGAGRLRPGLRGTVRTVAGFGVGFEVEAVDEVSRRWRWRVWLGPSASPIRSTLDHEIIDRPGGGCVATLRLEGSWPVVSGYAPLALLALTRLVAA